MTGPRSRLAAASGRLPLAAVALAIAASVVLSLGVVSAVASAQGDRLHDVRVCGAAALDRRAGQCTKDESGKPLLSSAFNCSADARAEQGERFAGRFFYKGQPFPAFGTSVTEKRRGVYVYLTAGPYPMPGGSWSCELRVGSEHVRKSFRSAGPVAPILYVSACRTSRTALAGPAHVCRRDESAGSFGSTESVTCSAVFVGGKGKIASIAFLHEGKEAGSGDFELPLPITAAGPRLDPDPKLAPGAWACRWSLAGRVVATKQFRVG